MFYTYLHLLSIQVLNSLLEQTWLYTNEFFVRVDDRPDLDGNPRSLASRDLDDLARPVQILAFGELLHD